jgi:hypothetical protein
MAYDERRRLQFKSFRLPRPCQAASTKSIEVLTICKAMSNYLAAHGNVSVCLGAQMVTTGVVHESSVFSFPFDLLFLPTQLGPTKGNKKLSSYLGIITPVSALFIQC